MSEIHESLTVLCPFDQTPQAAAAYIASLPFEDEKRVVPIRIEIGDLIVERRVDLTLKHVRAYPGYEVMDIQWTRHNDGPYPIFRGILSVEESAGNFCRLDLDGSYEPPFGIAGAAFDAVVGHRIALAASRQLLREIKTGFELAFQTGMTVA
ncbi:MAG TPA: hypothetical protein VIK27_03540 [Candidatus Aquilonibacter sp.]